MPAATASLLFIREISVAFYFARLRQFRIEIFKRKHSWIRTDIFSHPVKNNKTFMKAFSTVTYLVYSRLFTARLPEPACKLIIKENKAMIQRIYSSHDFLHLCFSLCSFSRSPQAVQEEVSIPGAYMKLSYLSTRSAGYLSLLRILLTPPSLLSPTSPLGGLSKVHVRTAVQGRLYQRWYPAGPGLVHRLVWNKTDIYGQEVWGLTHATGR